MAEWISLTEAVAAQVQDSDTVAMEGFTHLIPFAAGHEIIRRQRRWLSLIRMPSLAELGVLRNLKARTAVHGVQGEAA